MKKNLFSAASVLGSRPGSVGVGVTGCQGAAWVWHPAHRPGGSVRAGVSLALAVPSLACPRAVARAVAAAFPALRVSVRVWRGRWFVRVRGSGLFACACWFAGSLERAGLGG